MSARNPLFAVKLIAVLAIASLTGSATAFAQEKASGGPQDGIKVHGHWVIEVRNPNGSLVSRTEFENSLFGHPPILSQALTRQASVGFWWVHVGTGLCKLSDGTSASFCTLYEPNDNDPPFPRDPTFPTLSVSANNQRELILAGAFTAAQNGTVTLVATTSESCGLTLDPAASCPGKVRDVFTSHALTPGVSVISGQIVQITVTISFLSQ